MGTWSAAEAISALSFFHPGPRVGPVGRRVQSGHTDFGWTLTDWQVFVLGAAWTAGLLVVAAVQTAEWKRRAKKDSMKRLSVEGKGEKSSLIQINLNIYSPDIRKPNTWVYYFIIQLQLSIYSTYKNTSPPVLAFKIRSDFLSLLKLFCFFLLF